MSPQSEGRPSVDRGEGAYGSQGAYRQQDGNPSSQYTGRANGYGPPDAQRQRYLGPGGPGVGEARSPNGYMQPPPADSRNGRSRELTQNLPTRERSRNHGTPAGVPSAPPAAPPAALSGPSPAGPPAGSSKDKASRICNKCGDSLTGQFVRALGGTFHLECFLCQDCGQIVASKFFPMEDRPGGGQYPLCETDYFRRLDLLCFDCGGALRGSYITALDRKYHIEHFTCSVCPTVFGAQDSYYEHVGKVYCHYHYSTQFAQRCNGCQTAILKQFVEIFRNGQNQHWHPECYMIHKFWNVRLAPPGADPNAHLQLEQEASEEKRNQVRADEEQMEEKVYRIWSTLSTFEESSAACISDMLLHVSNGAYMESVMVAKKFIWHVDILFAATDGLDSLMVSEGLKSLSYGREAKLLCKKIVAFFTLLTKTQETGVRKLGVTQELLSLVTGLAHYLKLLIRISLQGALKLERERKSMDGLNRFLEDLQDLDSVKDSEKSLSMTAGVSELADQQSDICHKCKEPIDDECVKLDQQRWHKSHLACDYCGMIVGEDLSIALWSEKEGQIVCRRCHEERKRAPDALANFEPITRLQQYVYLLRVALARLLKVLRSGGSIPHTSDDPNLANYDSSDGHRVGQSGQSLDPPLLRANSRSKSYSGTGNAPSEQTGSSYEQTVGEMKRLRSTRMDTQLSTNIKKARTSRIMDGPEPRTTRPGSAGADGSDQRPQNFHIEEDGDRRDDVVSNLTFGNQDALTLDDIPRIVAAEQAKEQRPNAYKHARNQLVGGAEKVKFHDGHRRNTSGGNDLDTPGDNVPQRTKRYFSELSALEYFIVRHVAVIAMQPLLEGHFNLEELLNLIETRKPTFWGKFGKAFAKNDKTKGGKKKGVFGVPLDALVERDGVESTYGVGPGALRVPALIDDAISAMRQMDMSVEGVFRKNGNIKGLRDLTEKFDSKEVDVDLSKENPVQVAALLKKFLREFPDPLLTHKLYRLFVTSQKIMDEDKKKRVLHLTCCLLPKSHRDSLEILFAFLNWAASFSQVDEESGSKMDTHNLATVIAPNILKEKETATVAMDDSSFLGIEAVNSLIDFNDEMSMVPEDLQSILNDSNVFTKESDITTKEILKRYGDMARSPAHHPTIVAESADSPSRQPSSQATNGNSSNPNAKPAAPVITHVDTDPYQTPAWPKESSVRHVQGEAQGPPTYPSQSNNSATPPPHHAFNFSNPQSPYHRRGGSSESQGSARSGGPAGHSHKHSGWGKHGPPGGGPMGVTGAG